MRYNGSVGVRIGLDFFPAFVTLPTGTTLTPARVFVANADGLGDRVLVYIIQNGEPYLFYDRPLVSYSGNALRAIALQVADGEVLVRKEDGCGCGNPLKSFNPWPGERRMLARM